jgi:hypothetical protein
VTYRPAAKRWLCKQWPFLGNASNNRTTMLCNPFLSFGLVNASTTTWLLMESVFSIRSVQHGYKEGNWSNPISWGVAVQLSSAKEAEKRWCYSWVVTDKEFCVGGCDKRTWSGEVEESPLLEAVARERLLQIQQAGKILSGCCGGLWSMAISDSAVTACSSEWCV